MIQSNPDSNTAAEKKLKAIGHPNMKHHIFLCCDQTKPKCCNKERGLEVWDYLKRRLKETGLLASGEVFRSKANCLRVCVDGPIAVVYPDNIWYRSCSEEVIERIITEHLQQGKPVEEFRIDHSSQFQKSNKTDST